MSTVIKKPPMTPAQRTTEAARQASELLGLDDVKLLTTALAEVAVEGIRRNASFASAVRTVYQELATRSAVRRPASKVSTPEVELVPRKRIPGREANPALPPDPYFLLELYEADQLPAALARYTLPELRLSAEMVQERNPGTKPQNKSKKDAVIAYIVRYVAGVN